jgi:hypothetical protein
MPSSLQEIIPLEKIEINKKNNETLIKQPPDTTTRITRQFVEDQKWRHATATASPAPPPSDTLVARHHHRGTRRGHCTEGKDRRASAWWRRDRHAGRRGRRACIDRGSGCLRCPERWERLLERAPMLTLTRVAAAPVAPRARGEYG